MQITQEKIRLNLVVIRSSNLEQAVVFYRWLGLSFVKEQHGQGLEHFLSEVGGVVFEFYPVTESAPATTTRLGFQVLSVDDVVGQLKEQGVEIISPPKDSVWGRWALVADPDGNRVELTQLKL